METLWHKRFAALVWYIAARYFIIGLEYILLGPEHRRFWHFDDFHAVAVGSWMATVGAIGGLSRMVSHNVWSRLSNVFTHAFAIGVALHSTFRLWTFVQQNALGDPLAVLFLSDLVASFWILKQLASWKRCSH